MTRKINLLRMAHHVPERVMKCRVCRKTYEQLAGRLGDELPDALGEEQLRTRCCSWDCVAIYYNLTDKDGHPICYCGERVPVPAMECRVCRARAQKYIETIHVIKDPELARELSPPTAPWSNHAPRLSADER